MALISSSSGTTGLPKGVRITNANCMFSLSNWFPLNDGDHFFGTSAFFWLTRFSTFLQSILRRAPLIVTRQPKTAELVLDIVTKYKVRVLLTVPPLVMTMNELLKQEHSYDLSRLEILAAVGCLLPAKEVSLMNSFLPNGKVYTLYGTTDIGGIITTTMSGYPAGSVGYPVPGGMIKVMH